MASIDHGNSPRHNNVSRNDVDMRKPHNSATARTTDGDYDPHTERKAKPGGGMMKWLALAAVAILALIILFSLLGGDAEEATVVPVQPVENDAAVVTTEAPIVADEAQETVVAPVVGDDAALAPTVTDDAADTTLIETDATVRTVPVQPVD